MENINLGWEFQKLYQTDIDKIHDMEKIAAVSGISEYNITAAVTAVNPVDFSRIEDNDVDQSSDLLYVRELQNI